ncbi:MAG: hypothetical protein M9938_07485 [Solirubrobacterales bacterium]|nr:hypothetical protein [Solirubrobacterales bacterium]
MNTAAESEQICRLRAAASGREAFAAVREGVVYRDAETGEELEPVAVVLPETNPGGSRLPRSPMNLRSCRRCGQLSARDVQDCEYCGLPA